MADATGIRTDAGSVGHDSDSCTGPERHDLRLILVLIIARLLPRCEDQRRRLHRLIELNRKLRDRPLQHTQIRIERRAHRLPGIRRRREINLHLFHAQRPTNFNPINGARQFSGSDAVFNRFRQTIQLGNKRGARPRSQRIRSQCLCGSAALLHWLLTPDFCLLPFQLPLRPFRIRIPCGPSQQRHLPIRAPDQRDLNRQPRPFIDCLVSRQNLKLPIRDVAENRSRGCIPPLPVNTRRSRQHREGRRESTRDQPQLLDRNNIFNRERQRALMSLLDQRRDERRRHTFRLNLFGLHRAELHRRPHRLTKLRECRLNLRGRRRLTPPPHCLPQRVPRE